MSLCSRPKKLKPKGIVQELKIVQTVNRNGKDTIQTEEVKRPGRSLQKATSLNSTSRSSSPIKRRRLEDFDDEPVIYNLEGPNVFQRRQTLVFPFQLI
jgi:hypothetical protein